MAFISTVPARNWLTRYLLVGGTPPPVQLPYAEQVTIMLEMRSRVAKMTPMITVLAAAATAGCEAAFDALPAICQTSTMLFEFLHLYTGPWGRRLRRALATWYNGLDAMKLAYQITKYRSRHTWTHLDVLRLAHICPVSAGHQACFAYVIGASIKVSDDPNVTNVLEYMCACKTALECTDASQLVHLIRTFKLCREHCPPELMVAPVWDALLDNIPSTALLRNLAAMTATGRYSYYLSHHSPPQVSSRAERTSNGSCAGSKKYDHCTHSMSCWP